MISLSSFNNVYFPNLGAIFSPQFSCSVINTLFKGIEFSIKKLKIIIDKPLINLRKDEIELNVYQKIVSEGKYEGGTHILQNFLIKSKLINSIEQIKLTFSHNINGDLLFRLVSEHKLKNNLPNSFKLTYSYTHLIHKSEYWMTIHLLDLLRISPALNFRKINLDLLREKFFYKYEMTGVIRINSKEELNKNFTDFHTEVTPSLDANKLLYYSLGYNYLRPMFLMSCCRAELTKMSGEDCNHEVTAGSYQITKDEHLIKGFIKELDFKFTVISTNEGFEVKRSEGLQQKLEKMEFKSIAIKIKERFIEGLGGEYLQFVIFPLCLHLIEKEQNEK